MASEIHENFADSSQERFRKVEGMVTLEDYLSYAMELQEAGNATRWALGDLYLEMKQKFKIRNFSRFVASQMNCTAEYITQLMKVSKTFRPDERIPDMDWSLHRLCAYSKRPHYWLKVAADESLSVRELRKRMVVKEKEIKFEGYVEFAVKQGRRILREIQDFIQEGWAEMAIDEMKQIYLVVTKFLEGVET